MKQNKKVAEQASQNGYGTRSKNLHTFTYYYYNYYDNHLQQRCSNKHPNKHFQHTGSDCDANSY
jgi:hypothetical protein